MTAMNLAQNRAPQSWIGGLWLLILALALIAGPGTVTEARAAPESFADLAEEVSPAVVNITTSTVVFKFN